MARSLEQVKVDLAYSENPVTILGVSGGVAYGALGATHHSLHDIAVLRTFPGMTVCLPSDWRVTKKLVKFLVDYDKPWDVQPFLMSMKTTTSSLRSVRRSPSSTATM